MHFKPIFVTLVVISNSVVEAAENSLRINTPEGISTVPSVVNNLPKPVLRQDVQILNNIDEVRAFNKQWGDVRMDDIDGLFVLIQHSTTTHIGTLAGSALDYVHQKLGLGDYANSTAAALQKRQGECVHNICVIVPQCPQGCALCYPVICI